MPSCSKNWSAPSQKLEADRVPRPPTLQKNGSAAASGRGRSNLYAIGYVLICAGFATYIVIAWCAGWLP